MVYGIDGSLRGSAVANGGEVQITVTPGQIYIVKVGTNAYKVIVR